MGAMDVNPICRPFWTAFTTLSAGRRKTITMVSVIYERIEYTQMSQFARDHGYEDQEDFDEFVYLLNRMDAVYLEWVQSQQKR